MGGLHPVVPHQVLFATMVPDNLFQFTGSLEPSSERQPGPGAHDVRHAYVGQHAAKFLNRRPQSGQYPLRRRGLDDDAVDVIAIDALKHPSFESDPRRFDVCQHHRAGASGAEMGQNCDTAWIQQDC